MVFFARNREGEGGGGRREREREREDGLGGSGGSKIERVNTRDTQAEHRGARVEVVGFARFWRILFCLFFVLFCFFFRGGGGLANLCQTHGIRSGSKESLVVIPS